jgi:hypothetical protein
MILTASDVSSLARALSHWEVAEYVSCGLVAIGCIGEYVAEFTDWFTAGVKEYKDKLAKRSTLLLIVSLAFELVCLVQTNILSGVLIGSLNDEAQQADTRARKALGASDKAASSASIAMTLAHSAREEADSFEKDITSAKTEAAKAESDLADALQRTANAERSLQDLQNRVKYRKLTNEQSDAFLRALKTLPGGEIVLSTTGNGGDESFKFAQQLRKLFMDAGWKLPPPEGAPYHLDLQVTGVGIMVRGTAGKPMGVPSPVVATLFSAFIAAGITPQLFAYHPSPGDTPEVVIGSKPEP